MDYTGVYRDSSNREMGSGYTESRPHEAAQLVVSQICHSVLQSPLREDKRIIRFILIVVGFLILFSI